MDLLESTRRLLAELDEAERAAAGATVVPSGHLRLTAPLTFGRMHLMPVLAAFLREQPKVTATLVTLDRVANLIEEGFDLAVRIAHLPDSTIVARRIGEVRRILVASPGYLARQGRPRAARGLACARGDRVRRHAFGRGVALPARRAGGSAGRDATAHGQRRVGRDPGRGAWRRHHRRHLLHGGAAAGGGQAGHSARARSRRRPCRCRSSIRRAACWPPRSAPSSTSRRRGWRGRWRAEGDGSVVSPRPGSTSERVRRRPRTSARWSLGSGYGCRASQVRRRPRSG